MGLRTQGRHRAVAQPVTHHRRGRPALAAASRRHSALVTAARRAGLAVAALGIAGAVALACLHLTSRPQASASDQDALIGPSSPAISSSVPATRTSPSAVPPARPSASPSAKALPAPTAAASTGLAPTTGPASPTQGGGISVAQEESVLHYMTDQLGKPYSIINRFGPVNFDCSGLVWAALEQAGVPIPSDDNLVWTEIQWLGQVPGAQMITNVSDLQVGDLVAMPGSDAISTPYGPMGHIGIVVSGQGASAVILSAYDSAEGVNETSLSQNGGFTAAVRPQGGSGLAS
jgi:cell wall-associated NlpC family hydrolase